MKKSFKLQDLECANCAAKMETDINKLDGVNGATISFMTGKLTMDVELQDLDAVLDQAQRIVQKYEPGCQISR